MTDEVERKIFDMVEQGRISAEEALRLINAMDGGTAGLEENIDISPQENEESIVIPGGVKASSIPQIPEEELHRMNRLKRLWFVPFGIGLLIMTLGALWLYSAFSAKNRSQGNDPNGLLLVYRCQSLLHAGFLILLERVSQVYEISPLKTSQRS